MNEHTTDPATFKTAAIRCPSIASVMAGCHRAGEVVTVTGLANGVRPETSLQAGRANTGPDHISCILYGQRTAVRVYLFPVTYRAFGSLVTPWKDTDGSLRPPQLTITGRVDSNPMSGFPTIVATEVTRGRDDESRALFEANHAEPAGTTP